MKPGDLVQVSGSLLLHRVADAQQGILKCGWAPHLWQMKPAGASKAKRCGSCESMVRTGGGREAR